MKGNTMTHNLNNKAIILAIRNTDKAKGAAYSAFVTACFIIAERDTVYVAPPKAKVPKEDAKAWHATRAKESHDAELYGLLAELRAIRSGTSMEFARAIEAFASLSKAKRNALTEEGKGVNVSGMTLGTARSVILKAAGIVTATRAAKPTEGTAPAKSEAAQVATFKNWKDALVALVKEYSGKMPKDVEVELKKVACHKL